MKKLLPVLLTALLLASPAQAAPEKAARARIGIAATVNDEVITLSDVSGRMNLYLSGGKAQPPPEMRRKMELQVLDKLIDEKLQMQEAKKLGISVAEDQLGGAFAKIAAQNKFSPEDFKKRLAAEGVKVDSLKEQLKAEIAWGQVVRRKLRPQINISETEIDGAMDQIARARAKPRYLVAEIFLPVQDPAQDAGVKTDAEKIVAQIQKGARFPDMAREFSQAPGAAAGGDLGWIEEGQLDPALDAQMKAMQAGQLSPPVRTDTGYHILLLRDVRQPVAGETAETAAPAPAALAAAPDDIVDLRQILIPVDEQDPAVIVAAKTARAAALKAEITSCAAMAAKAADFPSEGTGELGKTPLSALPGPLRDAVAALKDGELSAPVRTDKGISVLMVCGREAGVAAASSAPAAPVNKDDQGTREQVANKIGMQRLEQAQERYLRDLRATAFIEKKI